MKNEFNKIKSLLDENIQITNKIDDPLERLSAASKVVDAAVSQLDHILETHHFVDNKEEILFFKELKPYVLSKKMEEVYQYNLFLNKPIGTRETLLVYYEEELRAFQVFFRMNGFHYQYYKNRLTDLDSSFFLRAAAPLKVPIAEVNNTNNLYITSMCLLFSKFIAYENLQHLIIEKIATIRNPISPEIPISKNKLKWTGDSINIVELAYGIWLTGQLNNGNATLNDIVKWLEHDLQISIGRPHRRFIEIERRKRLSVTKFMDHMRQAIINKVEEKN